VIVLERAPLDESGYRPEHPPINGRIPAVVRRFGPRTQIRWFSRFHKLLAAPWPDGSDHFYLSSVDHRGRCCQECERQPTYLRWNDPVIEGPCCCKATPPEGPREVAARRLACFRDGCPGELGAACHDGNLYGDCGQGSCYGADEYWGPCGCACHT
jgi:hypothetical protein